MPAARRTASADSSKSEQNGANAEGALRAALGASAVGRGAALAALGRALLKGVGLLGRRGVGGPPGGGRRLLLARFGVVAPGHVAHGRTSARARRRATPPGQNRRVPRPEVPLLDAAAVEARLAGLGWERDGDALVKVVRRASFAEAVAFVVAVACRAEAADHHPDIDLRWTAVTLRLTTHSAGGITEKDLALAGEVDRLG